MNSNLLIIIKKKLKKNPKFFFKNLLEGVPIEY